MIRRPPRSTQSRSSAASDVYKRQRPYRPAEALAWGSMSTRSTSKPASARHAARLTAVVVLPTPPFWLVTAMTRVTGLLSRGTDTSRWGGGASAGQRPLDRESLPPRQTLRRGRDLLVDCAHRVVEGRAGQRYDGPGSEAAELRLSLIHISE